MTRDLKLSNLTFAHRGLYNNIDIPENSLAAFQKALNQKIPIELDVQITKDNKLVIFHDNRLNRLTSSTAFVQDLTLSEIKALTLIESKEKIPTLQEALQLINGKVLLDIEIKNTTKIKEIGKQLLKELKNYSGTVIVKSFNPNIVKWFKKNTNLTCGLLITDNYYNKIYTNLAKSKWVLYYCQPDFLAISKKLAPEKKIQAYRKKIPLLIWTIESKEELKSFEKLGDSFICNNLPY